jgi:hypothetical protein
MPGIFISYRRSEAAGQAGRLFDRLVARFGEDRVFMDVDTLAPSDHFATRIEKAIANSDVMLVLIGPGWLASLDRLAAPTDFVRREIVAALRVESRLIPVCLDGATLPPPAALPEELRALVSSEGAVLRHGEFSRDADYLADILAKFVRPSYEATRRGLAQALARAGWPYSWFSGLVRRTSPRIAFAAIALCGLAVWAGSLGVMEWRASAAEPDVLSQLQATDNAVRSSAAFLSGTVTDDADRTIEDATVTLKNLANQRDTSTTTDSAGEFTIAYEDVGATRQSRLELAVTKTKYKRFREIFLLDNGLKYRRALKPDSEAPHAP